MTDVVSPEARSRMMAGIRGKDTKPEMVVRRGLHELGFRFRLHRRDLPGRPDIVLPKHGAAIFVHGCFWHGHDCTLFKWPKTRPSFWREKIARNREVDCASLDALAKLGWRRAVVWECAMKGRERLPAAEMFDRFVEWLLSNRDFIEIRGQPW